MTTKRLQALPLFKRNTVELPEGYRKPGRRQRIIRERTKPGRLMPFRRRNEWIPPGVDWCQINGQPLRQDVYFGEVEGRKFIPSRASDGCGPNLYNFGDGGCGGDGGGGCGGDGCGGDGCGDSGCGSDGGGCADSGCGMGCDSGCAGSSGDTGCGLGSGGCGDSGCTSGDTGCGMGCDAGCSSGCDTGCGMGSGCGDSGCSSGCGDSGCGQGDTGCGMGCDSGCGGQGDTGCGMGSGDTGCGPSGGPDSGGMAGTEGVGYGQAGVGTGGFGTGSFGGGLGGGPGGLGGLGTSGTGTEGGWGSGLGGGLGGPGFGGFGTAGAQGGLGAWGGWTGGPEAEGMPATASLTGMTGKEGEALSAALGLAGGRGAAPGNIGDVSGKAGSLSGMPGSMAAAFGAYATGSPGVTGLGAEFGGFFGPGAIGDPNATGMPGTGAFGAEGDAGGGGTSGLGHAAASWGGLGGFGGVGGGTTTTGLGGLDTTTGSLGGGRGGGETETGGDRGGDRGDTGGGRGDTGGGKGTTSAGIGIGSDAVAGGTAGEGGDEGAAADAVSASEAAGADAIAAATSSVGGGEEDAPSADALDAADVGSQGRGAASPSYGEDEGVSPGIGQTGMQGGRGDTLGAAALDAADVGNQDNSGYDLASPAAAPGMTATGGVYGGGLGGIEGTGYTGGSFSTGLGGVDIGDTSQGWGGDFGAYGQSGMGASIGYGDLGAAPGFGFEGDFSNQGYLGENAGETEAIGTSNEEGTFGPGWAGAVPGQTQDMTAYQAAAPALGEKASGKAGATPSDNEMAAALAAAGIVGFGPAALGGLVSAEMMGPSIAVTDLGRAGALAVPAAALSPSLSLAQLSGAPTELSNVMGPAPTTTQAIDVEVVSAKDAALENTATAEKAAGAAANAAADGQDAAAAAAANAATAAANAATDSNASTAATATSTATAAATAATAASNAATNAASTGDTSTASTATSAAGDAAAAAGDAAAAAADKGGSLGDVGTPGASPSLTPVSAPAPDVRSGGLNALASAMNQGTMAAPLAPSGLSALSVPGAPTGGGTAGSVGTSAKGGSNGTAGTAGALGPPTFYAPGRDPTMEGPNKTSNPGLNGKSVPTTIEQVAAARARGKDALVTIAAVGDGRGNNPLSGLIGKVVDVGTVTVRGQTLHNVKGLVHDTGPGIPGVAPHFDIAAFKGTGMSKSAANKALGSSSVEGTGQTGTADTGTKEGTISLSAVTVSGKGGRGAKGKGDREMAADARAAAIAGRIGQGPTAKQAGITPLFGVGNNNAGDLQAEFVARLNNAYNAMNDAEKASFNLNPDASQYGNLGYRSASRQEAMERGMDPRGSQVATKDRNPGRGKAATPGTSNHGFGRAVDIQPGPALGFLQSRGKEFGLAGIEGGLRGGDPVHIQAIEGHSGPLASIANKGKTMVALPPTAPGRAATAALEPTPAPAPAPSKSPAPFNVALEKGLLEKGLSALNPTGAQSGELDAADTANQSKAGSPGLGLGALDAAARGEQGKAGLAGLGAAALDEAAKGEQDKGVTSYNTGEVASGKPGSATAPNLTGYEVASGKPGSASFTSGPQGSAAIGASLGPTASDIADAANQGRAGALGPSVADLDAAARGEQGKAGMSGLPAGDQGGLEGATPSATPAEVPAAAPPAMVPGPDIAGAAPKGGPAAKGVQVDIAKSVITEHSRGLNAKSGEEAFAAAFKGAAKEMATRGVAPNIARAELMDAAVKGAEKAGYGLNSAYNALGHVTAAIDRAVNGAMAGYHAAAPGVVQGPPAPAPGPMVAASPTPAALEPGKGEADRGPGTGTPAAAPLGDKSGDPFGRGWGEPTVTLGPTISGVPATDLGLTPNQVVSQDFEALNSLLSGRSDLVAPAVPGAPTETPAPAPASPSVTPAPAPAVPSATPASALATPSATPAPASSLGTMGGLANLGAPSAWPFGPTDRPEKRPIPETKKEAVKEEATKKEATQSATLALTGAFGGDIQKWAQEQLAFMQQQLKENGGKLPSSLVLLPRKDGGAVMKYPRAALRDRKFPSGLVHSSVPGRTDKHEMTVATGSYVLPAHHVSGMGEGNTLAGAEIIKRMFAPGTKFGKRLKVPKIVKEGVAKFADGGRFTAKDELQEGQFDESTGGSPSGTPYYPEAKMPIYGPAKVPYPLLPRSNQPLINEFKKSANRPPNAAKGGGVRGVPYDALRKKEEESSDIIVAGGEVIIPPDVVRRIGQGDLTKGHDILDVWVKKATKKLAKTVRKLPGPKK